MRGREPGIRRARGFLLIVAVLLLVVVAVAVLALGNMISADIRAGVGHAQSEQAYFVAYSGLERATRTLLEPTLANRVPCASLNGNPAVTDVAAGPGKFSVRAPGGAAVYPSPPATLNGNLSATAGVIPVNSIAGYSARGRVMIDTESIDYSATSNAAASCGSAPCFVGAHRGMAGTSASTHTTGTRVGQFQCDVQSAGGVPDRVSPHAERVLTQGTQLQEAWAVGAPGGAGQRPWFVRFRENTWADLTHTSFNVNAQLNKVAMLSYADGWAVGNQSGGELIYHWTVTPAPGWARMAVSGAIPNVNLQGVHCLDASSCWAVGAVANIGGGGNNATIIRWTGGPAWTYPARSNGAPLPSPAVNAQLNSVWCNSANDCWAVGNNATAGVTGEVILRWTGGPRWTRMAVSGSIPNARLWSVKCIAANDCWAVGAASGGNAVIIRWTGGPAWSYSAAVLPTPAVNAQLNSVTCNSASDCWAVGNTVGGNEVILRWSGGPRWVRIGPSAAIANANLNAVSCVNAIDCWAVGNASGGRETMLHWDGSAWTQLADSASASNRNLFSVDVIGAAQRAPAARREVYP